MTDMTVKIDEAAENKMPVNKMEWVKWNGKINTRNMKITVNEDNVQNMQWTNEMKSKQKQNEIHMKMWWSDMKGKNEMTWNNIEIERTWSETVH